MRNIAAKCPDCGEVRLAPEDIRLELATVPAFTTYAFTCPGCTDVVRKPADIRVVRLLVSGGVTPHVGKIPAEALEARNGPPITHDDLLAFHELLDGDDWMSQL